MPDVKAHPIKVHQAVALGELLIDFVPTVNGVTLIEAPAFQKAPGGAPANVAAGLARLGISSGFMGKVGEDAFGHFLAQTLIDAGVDTSALCFAAEARTALAFVSLRADGERDFMFYRHPSADMLYTPEEVDEAYLQSARLLHFGSISLISEPSRSATLKAVEIARQAGLIISYDPNLRLPLWPDAEQARSQILEVWGLADIVKISDDELEFLTGERQLQAGQRLLQPQQRLLVITQGGQGCSFFTPTFEGHAAGYQVTPVDTTGAGDGFVAGLLKGVLENPTVLQDPAQLQAVCRYANAVGALATTRRGAIPALPTPDEVEALMQTNS